MDGRINTWTVGLTQGW